MRCATDVDVGRKTSNLMSLGEVVGCIVRIIPIIGELCNLLAFLKAWSSTRLFQLFSRGIVSQYIP